LHDEDENYASRAGRLMWRLAKRRAHEAHALTQAILTKLAAEGPTTLNKDARFHQQSSKETPKPDDPESLEDWIEALKEEIVEDDPDSNP